MFGNLLTELLGGSVGVVSGMMGLFPAWGFVVDGFDPDEVPYLGDGLAWLNWFVPVGVIAGIVSSWAACVLLYNCVMFFMRVVRDVRG